LSFALTSPHFETQRLQNGTKQQNILLIESFRIQRIVSHILTVLLLQCSEMKIEDLFTSRHYCNSNLLTSAPVITFWRKLFRQDARIRMTFFTGYLNTQG